MKGNCEDCTKRGECKKEIGIIFGYCDTDYECDFDTWLENHPDAVIQGHSFDDGEERA